MKYILSFSALMLGCMISQLVAVPLDTAKSRVRRVVNGQSTTILKYPWQIQLLKNGKFHCGGSIIGYQWVLTAAHCVHSGTPEEYTVVASSTHLFKENKFKVAQLKLHEDYVKSTLKNDIALIKINGSFTLDEYTYAVTLADPDTELEDGTPVRVSGHGFDRKRKVTELLKEVLLTTVSNERCEKINERILNSQLCVTYAHSKKYQSKSFCFGDSGGAAVTNDNVQVGVVSSVYVECQTDRLPGVLTKVSSYRYWIRKNTGIY